MKTPSQPQILDQLISSQNADGGWGYLANTPSSTEPTALALLALNSSNSSTSRAYSWLDHHRLSDGGWPPSPSVPHSTWVTAVALIARSEAIPASDPAVHWLLNQTGRETSWLERTRRFLTTGSSGEDVGGHGWPWFPGAAAWVSPTVFSILALSRVNTVSEPITQRIQQGRRYLLSHTCRDGGWNHGSSRALGYDADSYPETTGLALLAFAPGAAPSSSLTRAESHFRSTPSTQAHAWLALALRHHNRPLPAHPPLLPPRTLIDLALLHLASAPTLTLGAIL